MDIQADGLKNQSRSYKYEFSLKTLLIFRSELTI